MPTRRITYRLYPNAETERKLHLARKMHCELYNAALANRITQYKRFGHSVDYFEQQNSLPAFKEVWPEYKELGSQTLQATYQRVDFAILRFFNKLAKYPRFKAKRRYRGWTYPSTIGWKVHTNMGVNGQLELRHFTYNVEDNTDPAGQACTKPGPVLIQMRGKARTWGSPTTCTIFWSHNKWYASITVNCVSERETHPRGPRGGLGWILVTQRRRAKAQRRKEITLTALGRPLDPTIRVHLRSSAVPQRQRRMGRRRCYTAGGKELRETVLSGSWSVIASRSAP